VGAKLKAPIGMKGPKEKSGVGLIPRGTVWNSITGSFYDRRAID
jgi:hypothetical protein